MEVFSPVSARDKSSTGLAHAGSLPALCLDVASRYQVPDICMTVHDHIYQIIHLIHILKFSVQRLVSPKVNASKKVTFKFEEAKIKQ